MFLFSRLNSENMPSTNSDFSDSSSIASTSPRSFSPTTGWAIKYKIIPKKPESKGVWDGYQTKEEFMTMHFR
jgi:hypothetical protein